MKLELIVLEDFQAHKAQEIEFSPTITTIKGPTDVGKSAILRALRWVSLNDFTGTEFVREGKKQTRVVLTVSNSAGEREVGRVKSKDGATNVYLLGDEEFKSFGQSVPPGIAKLLNLGDLNFQGQHDPPFWFSETAGEISRQLNAVIDLSVIDTSLSNIGTEVRRAQERKNLCEERLKEVEAELKEMIPQRERIGDFKRLKELNETHTTSKENSDSLVSLLEGIRANPARALTEKAEEGERLLVLFRRVLKGQQRCDQLSDIIAGVEKQQAKAQPPPDLGRVESLYNAWQDRKRKLGDLTSLAERIGRWEVTSKTMREDLKEAEKQFHQQTRGQNCPLCGARLD